MNGKQNMKISKSNINIFNNKFNTINYNIKIYNKKIYHKKKISKINYNHNLVINYLLH
jgi:hypothetical protein